MFRFPNWKRPGGWEQSDPKRVSESLSVPGCCGACRWIYSLRVTSTIETPSCSHPSSDYKVIDVNYLQERPIWCPLNSSFVKAEV